MNETRRTHLEAIPPVPAIDSSLPALGLRPSFALSMSHRFPLGSILGAIVSVQAGAALAKGLFPALGPIGTVAAAGRPLGHDPDGGIPSQAARDDRGAVAGGDPLWPGAGDDEHPVFPLALAYSAGR